MPGLQQPPADERVDLLLVGAQPVRRARGGDDGVVIADLGVVDEAARERALPRARRDVRLVRRADGAGDGTQRARHLGGEVPAVGARIADELVLLVQRLGQLEAARGGEAVEPVQVPLQLRQVVQQRRRHLLRLRRHPGDARLARLRPRHHFVRFLPGRRQPLRVLLGARPMPGAAVAGPLARGEGGHHLEVVLGHEVADGQLALDQQRERGRLHPAHRERQVEGDAVRAGQVHPHQPVGAAASQRGVGQRVEVTGGTQPARSPRGWRRR